ncbi:MAG: non-heme iron oxygenase ferredoxin subunit [Chloroflexota bacterium]
MTEFIRVASVDDIKPGERLWVDLEEEMVIIFNANGTYYCIADLCSHDGGPLEDADLIGCEVECPRHGGRFDIRTGKPTALPAIEAIPTYEVKVENGEIYVEAPEVW